MAPDSPDVKRPPPENPCGTWRYRRDQCIAWIDEHPRLGWYLAIMSLINIALNVADLFK